MKERIAYESVYYNNNSYSYDNNTSSSETVSSGAIIFWSIVFLILLLFISYKIYQFVYFSSEKFKSIKDKVKKFVDDCNDMNDHIEDLKNTYADFKKIDFGDAANIDNSVYNYKRRELHNYYNNNYVYNCSLVVCRNAQTQPFKYLCKYFNIEPNEESLNKFETVLNNFSSAEQGKELLNNMKNEIVEGVWKEVPPLIRLFSRKRFEKELGFKPVDLKSIYFPTYIFKYISAGGNASMSTYITLNIENLNRFVTYLSEIVKFRKTIAGQRALMTSALREKIKKRDNYTCRHCSNSIKKEPNLLLEIDHIKPLSKGGITSEENLQTLCWRCNRSKGSKIVEDNDILEEDQIEE